MKISCKDFDLASTLESGQVFGFEKQADGGYSGRIDGHPARLRQSADGGLDADYARPHRLRDYFDLDRDMGPVFEAVSRERALSPALAAFRGLRLIRQDSWEALACFILSSNNNVKRIMGIHRNLTAYFGGFPAAERLAASHERILRQLGLGYRAPFLLRTARFVASNPGYLEAVREAGYAEAYARVLAFPGIGPKVADCVLLYGFHRLDAFPVDVWILRAMRKHYFGGRRVDEARARAYGQRRWGPMAGYIQQYLFHGARTGVL